MARICCLVLAVMMSLTVIQAAPELFSLRDWNSCRERDQSCRGYPRCCGTLQCYWEEGIKPWNTNGVCVDCVDRTLKCQRDAQCCGSLICHKDSHLDLNGVCDILRGPGEKCHEDKQCRSGECDKSWLSGECE